jgi:serine/threonine protein kinase
MKEVNNLKMLNHKNIVPYIGYCNENPKRKQMYNWKLILVEEPHMLLCMEYLPNGSLRDYIAGMTPLLCYTSFLQFASALFERGNPLSTKVVLFSPLIIWPGIC